MSWNPGIEYRGDRYIAQTGQNISEDLQKALAKYDEDKKQHEFNTGVFETIKGDPALKRYVPVEALENWQKWNTDKQAGTIAGIAQRASSDQKQQQEARQQQELAQRLQIAKMEDQTKRDIAAMRNGPESKLALTPAEIENARQANKIPLRQSDTSFVYADMADVGEPDTDSKGNPIFSEDGSMYRSGGKFKPVTKAMLEAHDAWQTTRDMHAEQLNKLQGGDTKKPRNEFENFLMNGPFAKPLQPPTPAPAAEKSVTAAPSVNLKTGVAGYVPGKRYGGKLYLGGDPYDAGNWQ